MAKGVTPTHQTRIDVENALLARIVGLLLENDRIYHATAPGGPYANPALHWYAGRLRGELPALRDDYAGLWRTITAYIAAEREQPDV